uniref:Uncharacterized protein n=1 Tax=Knipowitschia caucasica TaxID=637954 RepID=A0AAV2K653_KNICA
MRFSDPSPAGMWTPRLRFKGGPFKEHTGRICAQRGRLRRSKTNTGERRGERNAEITDLWSFGSVPLSAAEVFRQLTCEAHLTLSVVLKNYT